MPHFYWVGAVCINTTWTAFIISPPRKLHIALFLKMLIACLLRNKRFGSLRAAFSIDLVPVKHATSYFSPFLFELNKSRFTNTCTTTGFVSGDAIRNLVLRCYLIKTAFHSTETQFQRPGNYSLLQINQRRKQCTIIVRTIFILVINQLDAQNLFYNKFISCLYMVRAPCAHRQEDKIVLYGLWYHHTYRWPSRPRDGHL